MATSLYHWEAKSAELPSSGAPTGPTQTHGTNFSYKTLSFALNSKCTFHGKVPTNYGGGTVQVVLDAVIPAGVSGSWTWGVKLLGRLDNETFDAALGTQVTQADTVGTTGRLHQTLVTITGPALTVGDALILEVQLTASPTGGNPLLYGVEIQEA